MTVAEFINKVGFQVDQSSVNDVNNTFNSIKSTATKLLGAIGIGISLSSLNAIADEFNQINDRINAIVSAEENAKEVQRDILEAANDCKMSYADMASSVTSLVSANSTLFPTEDAATFVEYVNKIGKVAGYSDGEISSMMSSLQRIIAAGEVGSTDITRILRSTPALAKQLAEYLGVATDELGDMADNGELTIETIKEAVIGSADEIDVAFGNLNYSISDALLNIRNQWGFWVDDVNSSLLISQTLAKTLVKGFNSVMPVLNSIRNGLVNLNDALGGGSNLFKLLATVAGAFIAVMAWPTIVSGAQMFLSLLGKIKTAFGLGNIGVLALVAVIVALALIVEDFINFMQGNNSVIGYCFEQAGIDAEAMRQKIINIWNNLKAFFGGIWNSIKAIFTPILDGIMQKIQDVFGDQTLFAGIGTGVAGVIETIERITGALANNTDLQDTIAKIIVGIAGLVTAFNAVKNVAGIFSSVFSTISTGAGIFSKLFGTVKTVGSVFGTVSSTISKVISAVTSFINPGTALATVSESAASGGTLLTKAFSLVSKALNPVTAIIGVVVAAFMTLWTTSESFRESITTSLGNIVSSAQEFAQGIIARLSDVGINFENFQLVISTLGTVFSTVVGVLQQVWMSFCNIVAPIFEGAFSAISTVLSSVFDIITGLLDVFIGLFTGNWGRLWTGVQEIFSGVWDTITGIFSTILETISGVAANIVTAFMDMAQQAWDAITGFDWLSLGSNIVQGIIDGITGMVGSVVSAAADLGSNILSGFCDFLGIASPSTVMEEQAGYIVDGVINGIAGLPAAMTDALNQALVSVQQWAGQLVATLGTSISTAVSNVGQYFSGMGQSISTALSETLSVIATWGGNVMSSLRSAVTGASSAVVGVFGSMAGSVGNTLSSALSVVAKWGSNVASSLKSAAQNGLSSVTAQMSQMPTKIAVSLNGAITRVTAFASSIKSKMLSAGKATVSAMSSGLSGISSSVNSRLSSVTNAVKTWGTSLKKSFTSIGKNVISGIISGISSMVGSLYSSIKSALSGLVSKAKSALGIHSPSTVMRDEIGQYIPSGVAEGITQNSDVAEEAVSDMANQSANSGSGLVSSLVQSLTDNKDRIKSALQNAVGNMEVLADTSIVSPATAQTVAGGSTDNSRNVSQSVNINNTFNGDKAIQQKAASAMDSAAEDVTTTLARGLAYAR